MAKISANDPEQYEKFFCTGRQNGQISLGGKVDLRKFTNLKDLEITNHGITELKNYPSEQLEIFRVFNNNIQDELKPFGKKTREIKIFNDDMTVFTSGSSKRSVSNSFTGNLSNIIKDCKDALTHFEAHSDVSTKNDLSGLLPNLSEYKNLISFKIGGNKKIVGSIGNLSGLTKLHTLDISGTSISNVTRDFDIPDYAKIDEFYEPSPKGFRHLKIYDTPMSSETLDIIIDKIHTKATVAYNNGHEANELGNYRDQDNPTSSVEIGPAHLISDASFTKLATMRKTYKMDIDIHTDPDRYLLNNPFASSCTIAVSTKKIKGTSDKAMKIRRGVDDVTAIVYYDSDGNISSTSEIQSASNGKSYASAHEFLNEVIFLNPRITTGPRIAGTSDTDYDKIDTNSFVGVTNSDGSFKISATATSAAGDGLGRVMMGFDNGIKEKDTYRTRFRLSGDVSSLTTAAHVAIGAKSGGVTSAGGMWQFGLVNSELTLTHNTATVNGAVVTPVGTNYGQPTSAASTEITLDGIVRGNSGTQKFYRGQRVTGTNVGAGAIVEYVDDAENPTKIHISGSHPDIADDTVLTFSHGFDVGEVLFDNSRLDTQIRVSEINIGGDIHKIRYDYHGVELNGRDIEVGTLLGSPQKLPGAASTHQYISVLGDITDHIRVGTTGSFSEERFGMNEVRDRESTIFRETLSAINIVLDYVNGQAESITMDNFKIEAIAHSATVEEWYDQSGNGAHPTQTDKALQPEIAHDGLFLNAVNFGLARFEDITSSCKVNGATNNSTTLVLDGLSTSTPPFKIFPDMPINGAGITAGTTVASVTSQGSGAAEIELSAAMTVADDTAVSFKLPSGIEGETFMQVPSGATATNAGDCGYLVDHTGQFSILATYQLLNSDGGHVATNATGAVAEEGSGLYNSGGTVYITNGNDTGSTSSKSDVTSNNEFHLVGAYYNNTDVTLTENGDDGTTGETSNPGTYDFVNCQTTSTDNTFRLGNRNTSGGYNDSRNMAMKMKECIVFNVDKGTRTTSGLKYNQVIERTIMRTHGITSDA